MTPPTRRVAPLAALVPLAVVLAPGRASAQGNPERYPVGARASGMGGAGIGFGQLPWLNVAGLGNVVRATISGSLSAYGYTVDRVDEFIDADPIHGTLESASVDLFPVSLDYVKPLGGWDGFRHGLGVSIVVPDYEQFDGAADVPAEALAFELRLRREASAQTIWVLPGWGACLTELHLCVGAGPAMALHVEKELSLITLSVITADDATYDATQSFKTSAKVLSMGGHAGVQWDRDGLWLGATLRTPVRRVFSSGSILAIGAVADGTAGGTSYVDRAEVLEPTLDFRQSWRLGLGAGWVRPGYALAFDLKIHAAQPEYLVVGGPDGETSLAPRDLLGRTIDDPARALDVGRSVGTRAIANVALGGEVHVTDGLTLQLGGFSDRSATPKGRISPFGELQRLSRYGATLGVGLVGAETTTWISLVGALGTGDSVAYDANFEPILRERSSRSITLMLGSMATTGRSVR
jgi:hypothetical protein